MLSVKVTPRMMICAGVMKWLTDFSERVFVSRTEMLEGSPSALNNWVFSVPARFLTGKWGRCPLLSY
ncbi:hypothetical protein RAN53_00185 [Halomonas sp. SSL-5]|uniref:hypothetical protein n=1 Tax=Halomonas sp. SSL-5 TaxID=3065855 RepID=UPI0027393C89|nr:hypothetical protein [Halomonas sp. SSL-5]MDY7114752.1 hypothetical protein [Halomonas sp. SSL-5]